MTLNLLDDQTENTLDETSLREELINKWKDKTPEEILKAKVESDIYIKAIEKQKDQMREDYLKLREEATAQAKLQELIDRLENRKDDSNSDTNGNNVEEKPTFDPAQLDQLISSKIQETEQKRKQDANWTEVQNKLKEQFGNSYPTVLKDQMEKLGLNAEDVNTLARKSPVAFFNTLGLNNQTQEKFTSPLISGQRSDRFSPNVQKRDYMFYENLRKADPAKYWEPKTQVQMVKDAEELGASFGA